MQHITPANKVTILLNLSNNRQEFTDQNVITYDFIYGIGINGLSPLEKALSSKKIGEEVTMNINTGCWIDLFGHLRIPPLNNIPPNQDLTLTAKITAVKPASNREVIRALADLTTCAGGCDCGCGGH